MSPEPSVWGLVGRLHWPAVMGYYEHKRTHSQMDTFKQIPTRLSIHTRALFSKKRKEKSGLVSFLSYIMPNADRVVWEKEWRGDRKCRSLTRDDSVAAGLKTQEEEQTALRPWILHLSVSPLSLRSIVNERERNGLLRCVALRTLIWIIWFH